MGFLSSVTILATSTTFVGYVVLRHIRRVVKEIPIPQTSILFQHFQNARQNTPDQRHFADAFKATLPDAKQKEINVDQYAKVFFSSVIFKTEKTILKAVKNLPEYNLDKFEVGQSIYVWRVSQRNQNEILLTWDVYSMKGSTWFCLPSNEDVIMFGSSIQTTKRIRHHTEHRQKSNENDLPTQKPSTMGVLSELFHSPNDRKITNIVIENMFYIMHRIPWSIAFKFHEIYSVLLVYGVRRKLLK